MVLYISNQKKKYNKKYYAATLMTLSSIYSFNNLCKKQKNLQQKVTNKVKQQNKQR